MKRQNPSMSNSGRASKEIAAASSKLAGVRLAVLVLLLLLIAAGMSARQYLYDWMDAYPIEQINVIGELHHVDQAQLKDALEPYVADNFFTVDLEKVKHTAESLTWIDYADAKKEWPNTLIVLLHERVPVANWGDNEFLSQKGEIFSAEHVQPDPNLPTFIGRQEQSAVIAERFTKMQKILSEIGLSVKKLELEDRVSWKAQLNNGLVLVVDEKDSLEKIKRFVQLYVLFTDEQKQLLSKVDLRYENGLAIKWKKNDGNTDAA